MMYEPHNPQTSHDHILLDNCTHFSAIRLHTDTPEKRVPSARLKTAYVFNDGKTTGQTGGGFTPASGALNINWIISSARAPIAVSKTDRMKIFDPVTNQNADAWLIEYRKFHELWVADNKIPAVRVSTQPAA